LQFWIISQSQEKEFCKTCLVSGFHVLMNVLEKMV
jgi:hypothetical protein